MTWLISFIAKSALMSSPFGGFLKMIPAWAWKLLGAVVLVGALFWTHQHIAHKALKKADAAGYARAKDEDVKALAKAHKDALDWKSKFDANAAQTSHKIRENSDAQIASSNRLADGILRDGPGKASCGQSDYSRVSTPAGRPQSTPGLPAPAVDPVPDQERFSLIALPFSPTVAGARQCDGNLTEVNAWRTWYDVISKSWPH